jgi:hypothetical protein
MYKYEYVKQFFEDNNCKLLEDCYISAKTPMKYLCECGNISVIRFSDFKIGMRCWACRVDRIKKKQRHSLDYVKQYFLDRDCLFLEDVYINSSTKIKYLCKCGRISFTRFDDFRNGQRCMQCGIEKMIESQKLLFDDVYKYFQDNNCLLLENKYISNHTNMKYKCICGNISSISFANFQAGHRCKNCARSNGEKRIAEYLEGINSCKYIIEYKFNDCKNKLPLPFDFAIFDKDGKLLYLAEYDGEHHYISNDYFGGEEKFKQCQQNDQIKNIYCKQNNIPLLRIPYWDFDNIESIFDNFLSNLNQTQ